MEYQREFTVQAPLSDVVEFHRSASSLKAITPPLFFMSGLQSPPSLGDGDQMRFTLWLGPIPVKWQARIEKSSQDGFDDIQLAGPFDTWVHRHQFESISSGVTRISDQISYRVKRHLFWGPIGVFMALGLPVLFWYRARRTKSLLEGRLTQKA